MHLGPIEHPLQLRSKKHEGATRQTDLDGDAATPYGRPRKGSLDVAALEFIVITSRTSGSFGVSWHDPSARVRTCFRPHGLTTRAPMAKAICQRVG